tara:strand:+ start:3836 stop:4822 length:987 start_codon:yes stop_codon:yes gene_type:complete
MPPIAIVTGGAGFIGSHMVDLLINEGFVVRVIDDLSCGDINNLSKHIKNPDLIFEQLDIRNISLKLSIFQGADFCFHFAGKGDIVPSIEEPAEYMSVNVNGTVSLLEAARKAKLKKFIYAASSSCYGLAATPTNESHCINPLYPYALSKYLGESAALHWSKVYKLPVNSIRIFNAFGERSRTAGAYGAVFGVFLKQKLEGQPFTIIGDGEQSRDFLYVSDVTRAFLAAGETSKTREVYNLGAGKPQTINKLVHLLGGHSIYIPERPGEPRCTWADISKIQCHLNWKPEISFEIGVNKVLSNIADWKNAPLWDPASIEEASRSWFKILG